MRCRNCDKARQRGWGQGLSQPSFSASWLLSITFLTLRRRRRGCACVRARSCDVSEFAYDPVCLTIAELQEGNGREDNVVAGLHARPPAYACTRRTRRTGRNNAKTLDSRSAIYMQFVSTDLSCSRPRRGSAFVKASDLEYL